MSREILIFAHIFIAIIFMCVGLVEDHFYIKVNQARIVVDYTCWHKTENKMVPCGDDKTSSAFGKAALLMILPAALLSGGKN